MGGCRAVGDCIIKKDMGFILMAKTLKPNIIKGCDWYLSYAI